MTDERMSPDVRLREGEREVRNLRGMLRALGRHSETVLFEDDLDRIEERVLAWHNEIVAARVGEVVERVEAVLSTGARGEELSRASIHAVRAALRAAQAPPSAEGVAGGHGGAGGDLRAGEGE